MQKEIDKPAIQLNFPLFNQIAISWHYRWEFSEQLSQTFEGHLYVAMDKCIPSVWMEKLLLQDANITWSGEYAQTRTISATLTKIESIHDPHFPENYCYKLTFSAWLSLLASVIDAKIYIEKTPKEIIQDVLRTHTMNACDFQYLQKHYAPRPYTVRYFDDGLNFIHRLLSEANIHYSFEHKEKQSNIILHDCGSGYHRLPDKLTVYPEKTMPKDLIGVGIWNWKRHLSQQPDGFNTRCYARNTGKTYTSKSKNLNYAKDSLSKNIKNYLYPVPANATSSQGVDDTLKQATQASAFQGEQCTFETNLLSIEPGVSVSVVKHPNSLECGRYWINSVQTCISDYAAVPNDNSEQPPTLHISVTAVPEETVCSPLPSYTRHTASGLDNATVVGPSHQKDSYTDALGRVKLHFAWDKDNAPDAQNACWTAVKQAWAGKNHGTLFIPRIGQEVIVAYEEDDPEKPIVIGALTNTDNLPPFQPETYPYRSGYQSRSQGDADNQSNGNQLLFDDDPMQPTLSLVAQKDLEIITEGDKQTDVANSYVHTIQAGDFIQNTGGNLTIESNSAIQFSNGASQILIDQSGIIIESPSITLNQATLSTPLNINLTEAQSWDALMATLDVPDILTDTKESLPPEASHCLAIRLTDRYAEGDTDKQPDLLPVINQLTAHVTINHDLTEKKPIKNGMLRLNNYQPSDIQSLSIQLLPSGQRAPQTVLIIAKNTKSLPYVDDTITLSPSDFQAKSPHVNKKTNTTTYTCELTLLEPSCLFNFRHDKWQAMDQLDTAASKAYQAVSSYFESENASLANEAKTAFEEHELNHFKHHGNNVTLFIHGYNVNFGYYPKNFKIGPHKKTLLTEDNYDYTLYCENPIRTNLSCEYRRPLIEDNYDYTLYRDDMILKKQFGDYQTNLFTNENHQYDERLKLRKLFGDGAHKWLMHMEHNLNQAAGFDGQDYKKYTRLVGIAWQGNAKAAYDYMAATAMSPFPAKKMLKLIQQLHDAGIKINIMAHSLGNDVLMHLLTLCAEQGLSIDHVFMWEAAIPDNSFATTARYYFPMPDSNNLQKLNPMIPYSYNFTQAHKAVKAITVLFSKQDNILGPLPHKAVTPNTVSHVVKQLCAYYHTNNDTVLSKAEIYVSEKLLNHAVNQGAKLEKQLASEPLPEHSLLQFMQETLSIAIKEGATHFDSLWEKYIDPAAGLLFALIAIGIKVVDEYLLPTAQIKQKTLSIYHLANLFAYPLSYFLTGSKANYDAYYQTWIKHHTSYHIQLDNNTNSQTPFQRTLQAQIKTLREQYPGYYQAVDHLNQDIITLKQNKLPEDIQAEFKQFKDKPMPKALLLMDPDITKEEIADNIVIDNLANALKKQLINWVNQPSIQPVAENLTKLATVLLTVLLTDKPEIEPAMGYHGFDDKLAKQFFNIYQEVDQKNLLADHDAMLIPTAELMQKIYKQQLMTGKEGIKFDYFGQWKPDTP